MESMEFEEPRKEEEQWQRKFVCPGITLFLIVDILLCGSMGYLYLQEYFQPAEPQIVSWGDWTACINGERSRTALCDTGSSCANETSACSVSPWSEWTECSNQCGNGTTSRFQIECTTNTNGMDCIESPEFERCYGTALCDFDCSSPNIAIYIGDGYCDDHLNVGIPGCDFDGGDCCGPSTNTMFCQDCFCLLSTTKSEDNSTSNSTTSAIKGDDLVNCLFNSHDINNGVCDDFANIEECLFDGDDCCLETSQHFKKFCSDCECKKGTDREASTDACSFSFLGAQGDGFCHDELNNDLCDYDGGDCCLNVTMINVCDDCTCKNNATDVVEYQTKECPAKLRRLQSRAGCQDELNIPECNYSNGQCCGDVSESSWLWCDDCTCKDPRNQLGRDITWCEFAVSKGDGKCDDGNNIPECDYDGGDCCGCTVEAGMCTECQCLDPDNPFSNGDDCCEAHKMYDGKCDGQNNVAFCRYDGYDCCLGDSTGDFSCRLPESCKLSVLLDGVCDKINANPGCQYDGGSCPDTPDKPRVDLDFCYENILGDSVCDGSNNILQCNFDNGDCEADPLSVPSLVVIGGRSISISNDVELVLLKGANVISNPLPLFPEAIENAVSFEDQGTIFVTGGQDGQGIVTSRAFSLAYQQGSTLSNQMFWNLKQEMLEARTLFAGVKLGKHLVVIGGKSQFQQLMQSTELYDINRDTWIQGPMLDENVAGHCAVKIGSNRALLAGGYSDNDALVSNSYILTINRGNIPASTVRTTGPFQLKRKFASCERFTLSSGFDVVMMAGGVNRFGEPISLTEIFYVRIGQWAKYFSLPKDLSMSNMVKLGHRLALIGGIGSNQLPTASIYLFNEQYGWQKSHFNLERPKSSHTSQIVTINLEQKLDVGQLGQPNFIVAYGEPNSASEIICISERQDTPFSSQCQYDRPLKLQGERIGAIMVVNVTSAQILRKTKQSNVLLICGGLSSQVVMDSCNPYIDNAGEDTSASFDIKLNEPRLYAAAAQVPNGGWMVSGGFDKSILPLETEFHYSIKSSETFQRPFQKFQTTLDLDTPTGGHCMVYIVQDNFLVAGGMTFNYPLTLQTTYMKNFKSGAFISLAPLWISRVNHVCFSRITADGKFQVVVAGGRKWLQAENITSFPTETYLDSVEIFQIGPTELKDQHWEPGPKLPYPLAFASTVITARGSWIVGGKTSPRYGPESFTNVIWTLTQDDIWIKLAYEIKEARSSFVTAAVNSLNLIDKPEALDQELKEILKRGRLRQTTLQVKNHAYVIDQTDIYDLRLTESFELEVVSASLNSWPDDTTDSFGSTWNGYFVLFRAQGLPTMAMRSIGPDIVDPLENHQTSMMPYLHRLGQLAKFEKFLWIVGGFDSQGSELDRSSIFTDGVWYEGPRLPKRVSETCAVALENAIGFIAAGSSDGIFLGLAFKFDFGNKDVTEFKNIVGDKSSSLKKPRAGMACAKVFAEDGSGDEMVVLAGGGSLMEEPTEVYLDTVEVYNVRKDEWSANAVLPSAMKGSIMVSLNNKLFLFGGKDNQEQKLLTVYKLTSLSNGQWQKVLVEAPGGVDFTMQNVAPVVIPFTLLE